VTLWQVPELVPDEILEKSGANLARAAFAHVPVAKPTQLAESDAIIFGAPTRFGNTAAHMRSFPDQTGGLWANGALVGKIGSVFTSTVSQNGGHETPRSSASISRCCTMAWLHLGMIVVGLPHTKQRLLQIAEITGGTPYRATTLAGIDRWFAPAERKRARHRRVPGQPRDTDRQHFDRRPHSNGRLGLSALWRIRWASLLP
jgi:NAD(P)H dehydrogenase (quinone)